MTSKKKPNEATDVFGKRDRARRSGEANDVRSEERIRDGAPPCADSAEERGLPSESTADLALFPKDVAS